MAYTENGGEKVKDFHGGDENFTGLSYMAIPLSIWQTMTALIFDGVFDRHPNLSLVSSSLGLLGCLAGFASWIQGSRLSVKSEARLQALSMKPSELAERQLRVTPIAMSQPVGSSGSPVQTCCCSHPTFLM